MAFPDLKALEKHFGAAGRIGFREGAGGFPVVVLAGPHGSCEVSLYGGQVLSHRPPGQSPVLFVSRQAVYEPGKPIRGGIPVCWPWFGAHPSDRHKPAHGFARLLPWTLLSAEYSSHLTDVKLSLVDSEATRAFWPHAFELVLRVVLDRGLRVELTTRNRDHAAISISEALHTYLRVRDIGRTVVRGLDGRRYFDALTGREHAAQKGDITFHGETDRVYRDPGPECVVEDAALGREIVLDTRGSHDTVVWNPWIEKSRRLADLGDDEYTGFLCVETANARPALTLQPGETHTLTVTLQVQSNA
jgi:D-hexose-6-phosphate mutarotase